MTRWEVINTDGVYTVECTDEDLCGIDDVCPLTFDNESDANWLCAFLKAADDRVEDAEIRIAACGPQTETIVALNATIAALEAEILP